MNTKQNNMTGRVVRGQTFTSLRYQPKRVFCMGEALTDKLDEFLWSREHERALKSKPQQAVQQKINSHLNAVREAQQKRHEEALNIGGF